MCRSVNCKSCGKTTWAGCGAHVDSVMKNVAEQDKCKCTPADKAQGKGFLSRIFGR